MQNWALQIRKGDHPWIPGIKRFPTKREAESFRGHWLKLANSQAECISEVVNLKRTPNRFTQ